MRQLTGMASVTPTKFQTRTVRVTRESTSTLHPDGSVTLDRSAESTIGRFRPLGIGRLFFRHGRGGGGAGTGGRPFVLRTGGGCRSSRRGRGTVN